MRRGLVILVAFIVAGAVWWALRPEAPLEGAYIRGRSVSVWNRVAEVRDAVATLHYGDVVGVLDRRGENVRIRTPQGDVGWVAERHLMAPELWEKTTALLASAQSKTVQARGRTKVLSNLRAAPGRDAPRIIQLSAGVPVEVLARQVVEFKPSPGEGQEENARREDWVLVHAIDPDVGDVAGWVLGRFIEPDLPSPLRDLGAGVRWMAWFELDRAMDESGERGEFLGVGSTGPEGGACDFSLLRVYTWNLKRHRYETAYVESNLCGRLPVHVKPEAGETFFSFRAIGRAGEEQREYRFRQNIVRRIRKP
jgi:hypothetical protein